MLKRLIVLSLALGLVAMSGIALASEEDKEDTVFNFGYDETSQVFVWNMTADDGLYDCTLENGPLITTYGLSADGLVHVDGLTDGSDALSFPARPAGELADGLIAADEPFEYSGADDECGLKGGTVAGPNGQVNHGMFMRLFNSLFDGPGRGCVNRFLARSDLGKGDQQVRVPDVDPNAPALTDGTMGLIEFETVLADCARGNEDKLTGQDKAAEKKAEQAEKKAEKKAEQAERKADKQQAKADKQRGRSDSAPGKNK